MILALSIGGVCISIIPAVMFLRNLPLFLFSQPQQAIEPETKPGVSVLIPARDEEDAIESSIQAALASRHVDLEVIVLDDHSTDRTAAIVKQLSDSDARVKYVQSRPLPRGWNGKQYACRQLADSASHDCMVFLDADVRLRPDALIRLVDRQNQTSVALLSAFPHQETETTLEKWIIPMMHYLLLGYLPLARMRAGTQPAYAAGCGQLFMTGKSEYQQAGTHEAIRQSRHDGLTLPRAYRRSALATDVVDGTSLAECRMYRTGREVIRGVLKNATEGIANPRLIVPFSILLLGGSVLPVVTFVWAACDHHAPGIMLSLVGIALGHIPRAVAAIYFRQSLVGVVFHSLATLTLVMLQWVALANQLLGRPVAWRGRTET